MTNKYRIALWGGNEEDSLVASDGELYEQNRKVDSTQVLLLEPRHLGHLTPDDKSEDDLTYVIAKIGEEKQDQDLAGQKISTLYVQPFLLDKI